MRHHFPARRARWSPNPLTLPLHDPDNKNSAVAAGNYPKRGNGLIGNDPEKPGVVVASNGGSNLLYVPAKDPALTAKIVSALLAQDYVSGIFVDDELGSFPGTRPMSAINLEGSSVTPRPSIVINFRSYSTGCEKPVMCAVNIADTGLQQGQGMHGSFNRSDTMNFMAAAGRDFKSGFVDEAPVSNADIGKAIAQVLGLKIPFHGSLMGRIADEALPGQPNPTVEHFVERANSDDNGSPPSLSASVSVRRGISTRRVSRGARSEWMNARLQAADESQPFAGGKSFPPRAFHQCFYSLPGMIGCALMLFGRRPIRPQHSSLY